MSAKNRTDAPKNFVNVSEKALSILDTWLDLGPSAPTNRNLLDAGLADYGLLLDLVRFSLNRK